MENQQVISDLDVKDSTCYILLVCQPAGKQLLNQMQKKNGKKALWSIT